MWLIVSEKDQKRLEESTRKQLDLMAEEARKKAAAVAAWKQAHTCPHCGRCDPLPPWLL